MIIKIIIFVLSLFGIYGCSASNNWSSPTYSGGGLVKLMGSDYAKKMENLYKKDKSSKFTRLDVDNWVKHRTKRIAIVTKERIGMNTSWKVDFASVVVYLSTKDGYIEKVEFPRWNGDKQPTQDRKLCVLKYFRANKSYEFIEKKCDIEYADLLIDRPIKK